MSPHPSSHPSCAAFCEGGWAVQHGLGDRRGTGGGQAGGHIGQRAAAVLLGPGGAGVSGRLPSPCVEEAAPHLSLAL